MSGQSRLQLPLGHNETILWEGQPKAPQALSAYQGWHTWAARAFFALSAAMTLLIWTNGARVGLSWVILGLVGVPIVIGLALRTGFAWQAREKMRALHYAVTNKRILIRTKSQPMSVTIRPDTPAEIIAGRGEMDVLRFADSKTDTHFVTNHIDPQFYTLPKCMVLPHDAATDALAAINQVKASL